MILLDGTISIDALIHIGELIALLGTGFAAFWKLNNKVDVINEDLKNSKETTQKTADKLEIRVNESESKLDKKISHLEEKIDRLPKDIIELFRQLK